MLFQISPRPFSPSTPSKLQTAKTIRTLGTEIYKRDPDAPRPGDRDRRTRQLPFCYPVDSCPAGPPWQRTRWCRRCCRPAGTASAGQCQRLDRPPIRVPDRQAARAFALLNVDGQMRRCQQSKMEASTNKNLLAPSQIRGSQYVSQQSLIFAFSSSSAVIPISTVWYINTVTTLCRKVT